MDKQSRGKTWTIYAQDFETDIDFRAAVEQALVDIFPIAYWRGRGVTVAPLRVRKDDGTYQTEGFALSEVIIPSVKPLESPAEQPDEELTDEELNQHFPEPVGAVE